MGEMQDMYDEICAGCPYIDECEGCTPDDPACKNPDRFNNVFA